MSKQETETTDSNAKIQALETEVSDLKVTIEDLKLKLTYAEKDALSLQGDFNLITNMIQAVYPGELPCLDNEDVPGAFARCLAKYGDLREDLRTAKVWAERERERLEGQIMDLQRQLQEAGVPIKLRNIMIGGIPMTPFRGIVAPSAA